LLTDAEWLRLRYEKGSSETALVKFRQAIDTALRAGDHRGAARAGLGLGATYGQLGLLDPSFQAYREALTEASRLPDRELECATRSATGIAQALVADRAAEFEEARRQCQRSREIARELKSEAAEARSLHCLGEVAYYSQNPDVALDFYRDAAARWERLDDRRGRAEALLCQGYVHSDLRRLDEARARYAEAESLFRSLGDTRQQAITLVAEARLKLRLTEYQQSLEKFEAALTLLPPRGDAVWEGSALTGIGEVYMNLAGTASALKYWERALQLFLSAGLKNVAVDVLMSLGATYLASGDDANALDRFQRAMALADEMGIDRWRAFASRYIGVVYLFRGQPVDARLHLEKALALQNEVGDPRLAGMTRADLGELRLLMNEPLLATKDFQTAVTSSQAAGDRVTQTRGLYGLARTSARRGDLQNARAHIEDALSLADSLRSATENRDLRASYSSSVYRYNEFHVDVLMRLHQLGSRQGLMALAFEASERARARSLLDSLVEGGVDLHQDADPALLQRERAWKRAFDDWTARQRRVEGEPQALADQYRDLQEQYGQIQAEFRSRSPGYAALALPEPPSLAELQQQVLDGDSLLLEYALGDERSYLWAVTRGESLSYVLPPRRQIEAEVRRAYDLLTARLQRPGDSNAPRAHAADGDASYWKHAQRLSAMLLGPVANRIAGKRILLVPDGALHYLPFAALPIPGRGRPTPLVVEHEVVNLPSASVLAAVRREARDRRPLEKAVAVLADPVFERDDPRLPTSTGIAGAAGTTEPRSAATTIERFPRLLATRAEAAAVVAAAPAGSTFRATGFAASRATATSPELARYRILHFATHSVFDDDDPGSSGIVLSLFDEEGLPQDGLLRLRDLYGLKLPVEMVVLSACDTALGKELKGEGLVGVVRGFMYAGSKRVVASAWRVDDEATGELMGRFYRAMLKDGRSPAAALREAQLGLLRSRRWQAPFYWAAFVLQGEPN